MNYAQKIMDDQTAVKHFNQANEVGTKVRYWTMLREGSGKESATRTPAQMLSGHTVVWVSGQPGCIALTHIQVVA